MYFLDVFETQAHNAKDRFFEDAGTHLRCALCAIDKDNGHLHHLIAKFPGSVFHFNLKCIANKSDPFEIQ